MFFFFCCCFFFFFLLFFFFFLLFFSLHIVAWGCSIRSMSLSADGMKATLSLTDDQKASLIQNKKARNIFSFLYPFFCNVKLISENKEGDRLFEDDR